MSKGVRRCLFWLGGLVVVIILVLPNIHRTGGHGSRIACANNLKQVGIGIKLYADEHDDVYPQKFSEIIQYVSRHAAIFVCAESGNKPESIETVDEWTDYVYILGFSTTSAPNAILAYCDPKNHNGEGGNILFVDGNIEWFNSKKSDDRSSFGDMIRTIGEQRKP
jgi:prepilin-type processing-associated H-X9-DG protein